MKYNNKLGTCLAHNVFDLIGGSPFPEFGDFIRLLTTSEETRVGGITIYEL